jgi:hypothetical protein
MMKMKNMNVLKLVVNHAIEMNEYFHQNNMMKAAAAAVVVVVMDLDLS